MQDDYLEERPKVFFTFFFPLLFIAVLWLIWGAEQLFSTSFSQLGVLPREVAGLLGVITHPLVHGDWEHLFNNSVPLLVLGMALYHFYKPIAFKIVGWTWLITGVWLWVAARPAYHLGASGLIYGFASFIFCSGVIRKHFRLLALALLVAFLYGSMVWYVMPVDPLISWEGHLFGAIAGLALAIHFRKYGPQRKRYEWEDEDDEEDDDDDVDFDWQGNGQQDVKIHYHYQPNTPKEEGEE